MVTTNVYPFTSSSSSLNGTKHTTHWKEFPAWGISTTTERVSLPCRTSLQQLFLLRSSNKTTATINELAILRVATEASSHPSGILALQAQPWVYAGGGLGNEPECLALDNFHTCLAGSATAAAPSLTFARLCWPAECTAHDLVAEDLVPLLLNLNNNQNSEATQAWTKMNIDTFLSSTTTITSAQKDYATQIIHMLRINRFLQTGWTCGYWQAEWNHAKMVYGGVLTLLIGLVLWASSRRRQWRQRKSPNQTSTEVSSSLLDSSSFQHGFTFSFHSFPWQLPSSLSNHNNDDDDTDDTEQQLQLQDNKEEQQPLIVPPSKWPHYNRSHTTNTSLLDYSSTITTTHTITTTTTTTTSNSSATSNSVDGDSEDEEQQQQQQHQHQHEPLSSSASSTTSSTILQQEEEPESQQEEAFQWYHAFCWRTNLNKLCTRPPCRQTASLDGLRVLSLLWIVLGHVMAIASSTLIGPGYSNPVDVLPPQGWTTTLSGQVVFSSRLAVDTFFVLSGFLLVHVLVIRQSASSTPSSRQQGQQQRSENDWSSSWSLPFVLVARLARLLPLYAFTLAFYMLLAPHLNGGPFWHQWRGLLEPCYQKNGWLANLLFVNNLWTETSVTETCFYHSWYLAVDIQLFVGSTLLLSIFREKTRQNRMRLSQITALLFGLSVCWTAYGSWVRKWSINTFDGAAVARYDVEAYAHPLTRAQAYLAGMFVALQQSPRLRETISLQRQSVYGCYAHCWLRVVTMALALALMAFVSFVTVTGAYAQRPCQYQEWPGPGQCGSTWSPITTFLYTAFSRTLWILAVSVVMFLCLTGDGWVASLLSWQGWVPLSHLSFGVYLIHPIVIFVWQLGGRDKTVFRLVTFGMNYVNVCVVSYAVALMAALLVELPFAVLWKHYVASPAMGKRSAAPITRQQPFFQQQKDTRSVYGATTNCLESRVETR